MYVLSYTLDLYCGALCTAVNSVLYNIYTAVSSVLYCGLYYGMVHSHCAVFYFLHFIDLFENQFLSIITLLHSAAFSQCRQYTVTLCTPSHSVDNTLSHSARLLAVSPIHCLTLHAFSQCRQYTVTLCTPSRSVANTLSHSARLLVVSPIHCLTLHAFSQCLQYTVTLHAFSQCCQYTIALCTSSCSVANTPLHSARLLAVLPIHCTCVYVLCQTVARTLCCQYTVASIRSNSQQLKTSIIISMIFKQNGGKLPHQVR